MSGGVEIKKRSRIPGVIITQCVENIPHGKSTPDFIKKHMAINIQEGKSATFRAVVSGDPEPSVTWTRSKGDISDPEKYNTRFDKNEHILQILNATPNEADTYQCCATNTFGNAVCTATLKISEAGFGKNKQEQNEPEDFRKMLKKTVVVKKVKEKPKKEGEVDPKFWEMLLSAHKKDYERICREFGITDFRWMLKILNQLKKEREEQQSKYVEKIENMKPIVIKPSGRAEFELEMKLKNPSSKILLYKNGELVQYGDGTDKSIKYNLKKVGDKYTFSIDNVNPEDSALYQVNVEDANMFTTELEIPDVEFDGTLKDVTVAKGKDATFQCVLSGPVSKLAWFANDESIEADDKYDITVSEDMLTHKLVVKNCGPVDNGTYAVTAGLKSSKAALNVKGQNESEDFRKMLKKTGVVKKVKQKPKQEGEVDPVFWEKLLSAQKKDYDRICREFGITDFRWMLKKLNQMKKEREEEQAKYVEKVVNMKPVKIKPSRKAQFELHMKLKNPKSQISLYKNGELVKYGDGTDASFKCNMKKDGDKYAFIINNVDPEDSGLYQVEVEDTTMFTTDLEIPEVEFNGTLKDVTVDKGKDATFECVLSDPVPQLDWFANDESIEADDKYDITVSEDMLTHKLVVKNCGQVDNGTYSVTAGVKSSKAALNVNDDPGVLQKSQHNKDNAADLLGKEKSAKLKGAGNSESSLGDETGRDGITGGGSGQERKGELGKDGSKIDGSGKGDMKHGDGTGDTKRKKELGGGQSVPDTNKEPEVHFVSGLTDSSANVGETAELSCTLSNKNCDGIWYKDGQKLESINGITISKDGALHKLTITNCQEGNEGSYKFEAEGRKSEAVLIIKEPPYIDADAMDKFSEAVVVRSGENAIFKLPFSGKEPIKVQWFHDDVELSNGPGVRIDSSSTQSRLLLNKCQRKNTGEVKIKLKNEFATTEATSKLVVLTKPTPPQSPIDVVESSLSAIEFKWRPPKDDGGCPVTNYILERQQVGRNTWTKIGEIPGQAVYRDTDIDRGKKYCYRIRAKNSEGISDVLETDDIAAGTLAFPGPPASPKVVSAFKDCINLTWQVPTNTGGGSIIGYNLDKRKKGSNLWTQVNPPDEPIREKKHTVLDVMEGTEYEFRVTAVNTCGPGEPSSPSDGVFARDPQKRPGKVKDLKVTGSSYNTLGLAWTKPNVVKGVEDEVKGYFVEIRPADQLEWSRCNSNSIIQTSFTITGLKSLAMYWVRVIAANEGGEGDPQGLDNYVIAMPPPVKPKFTDRKMKNFMVVKAGNTVRVSICYEASPLPNITWLKDNFPVGKHVTISNSEKVSQLLIPTSDRSDSGIYTIIVKNMVGQETFSVEVRVTDEPKPPGEVQLEQNVEGTLTLNWIPSPDEKRDDRLHYMVMKRDSVKRTWWTVADHLFNHKFTIIIMHGREYKFRVYAKNDMGLSEPSESPTWGAVKVKEKLIINRPEPRKLNFQSAPKFTVPLKMHVAPKGYECYMSCSVSGNPAPRVTWYHNNVNINTNTNYYISNTCGVCSLLVLMAGPKDTGEYKVTADSRLGHAESSTMLTVRE